MNKLNDDHHDVLSENPSGAWIWVRWTLAILCLITPTILLYIFSIGFDVGFTLRTLGILGLCCLGGLLLPLRGASKLERALLGLLIGASLVTIGERLARVSSYPFSLGWSEGNHFWNNSLFFIRDQYPYLDGDVVPNYVTLGIAGLRGLPFLLSDRSITLHRMWEATLWILPGLLLGWALTRRWRSPLRWQKIAFLLWSFLFLSQGPIYFPLLLAIIPVVVLTSREKPLLTGLTVFFMAIFAGLGRWTWMIAPATYAILLMMLEDSDHGLKIDEYIRKRFPLYVGLLAVGMIGGLISQAVTTFITHNPPFIYLGTMRHPLLWERLWPNPTFTPGIILGLLVLVGPLIVWLLRVFSSSRPKDHPVTRFLTILLGAVLLAGGLVVSVKIGAGGDLHDLDMFLIFLLILVNESVRRIFHHRVDQPESWPEFTRALAFCAALTPILWAVMTSQAFRAPDPVEAQRQVQIIKKEVEEASAEGEVLFIDQRQLLAFNIIDDIPHVPEYELVEVMDYAMAGNDVYFIDFYQDLRDHRFSLIIAGAMGRQKHRIPHPFEAESEAWRNFVSLKLLDLYGPAIKLDDVGVWIYKPIETIEN